MGELIWVGNTLLPRGLVFAVVAIVVVALVATFVALTDSHG